MRDVIQTERLLLRPPVQADAEAIFRGYAQDTEVTRYLSWFPHAHLDETRLFLQHCVELWSEASRYPWVITLAGDGDVIGMIELRPDESTDSVGFVLARDHWGQGYMTEALQAVLDLAVSDVGMASVGACCHVENRASARVMERAGMRQVSRGPCPGMYPNVDDAPEESLFFRWVPKG